MKHVKANYFTKYHIDAAARAMSKLLAHTHNHRLDVHIPTLLNIFWKDCKLFTSETHMFEKRNIWNVTD
jgi:hypothetical protein